MEVQPIGQVAGTIAALRHHVCEARCRIVVDRTDVTFIDSVGLGVLIEAQRRTRSAGGWMRLVCTDPEVLTVLRVTDLDDVFTIVDTVDQARAAP